MQVTGFTITTPGDWIELPVTGITNSVELSGWDVDVDVQSGTTWRVEYLITRNGGQFYQSGTTIPVGLRLGDVYNIIFKVILETGQLTLLDFKARGVWNIKRPETAFSLLADECAILAPEDVWKVFSVSGWTLTASGTGPGKRVEVKFRWSQDAGKRWSRWEPLTDANLRALRPNSLRFFLFEFSFCRVGSDKEGEIKIWDLSLTGRFQNVTKGAKNGGLLGLRTCPNLETGQCDPVAEGGIDCNCLSVRDRLAGCEPGFKPYEVGKAVELYEYLANQVSKMFGWNVDYYKTEPDSRGRDIILNEYQLFNVVNFGKVKVNVPENQFPDNQIQFNQFDLSLFDTFEVHITKEAFKSIFGVEERPGRLDYLFFCDINRLFQVEHAQPYRDFMHTSVYYKVVLKKAQNNKNVQFDPAAGLDTVEAAIQNLVANSSLDSLFAGATHEEMEKIAQKPQLSNLSNDLLMRKFASPAAKPSKVAVKNGPNIIATSAYSLKAVAPTAKAIQWNKSDIAAAAGDVRTFMAWFKPNSIKKNKPLNLLKSNNIDLSIMNGYFKWSINDIPRQIQLPPLDPDQIDITMGSGIWYAIVAELDQRIGELRVSLWRRKSELGDDYNETDLVELTRNVVIIPAVEWESSPLWIAGSDTVITNIRYINDLIELGTEIKLLNQNIFRDSSKAILIDNAAPLLPAENYGF